MQLWHLSPITEYSLLSKSESLILQNTSLSSGYYFKIFKKSCLPTFKRVVKSLLLILIVLELFVKKLIAPKKSFAYKFFIEIFFFYPLLKGKLANTSTYPFYIKKIDLSSSSPSLIIISSGIALYSLIIDTVFLRTSLLKLLVKIDLFLKTTLFDSESSLLFKS